VNTEADDKMALSIDDITAAATAAKPKEILKY